MPVPGYRPDDEARWVAEPPKRPTRTAFARDRARVLHCAAWRRLAAKTQVMIAGQGDFPRTRMTHSLEVAQVGRELGAALGCDADLVETACLAHDLGHPPFGHNGEDALAELSRDIGGFEGNAQTLRILTRLEAKGFGDPDGCGREHSVGLNLTRATLDAATKYPWPRPAGGGKFGAYVEDLPVFQWLRTGAPEGRSSFEAQVMDWADDVAYSVHDVEDGIHAGLIDLGALADPQTSATICTLVATTYLPGVAPEALSAALQRLIDSEAWPSGSPGYTGSQRDLAALKDLTSQLIGRFSAAAESATRAAFPQAQLTMYAGSVVVPDETRHEVAVLKGIANLFVMQRTGSARSYDRQRALIAELVSALTHGASDRLE
ncbi:MAG: deoxyguanosinetriphosphate triphosphohydrolase, partial [Candidatus Nanopelagicales bacterium]